MAILGELEQRIMDDLWRRHDPASVREVHDALRSQKELAYTTVMTVLDRLAKKGLAARTLHARAWLYTAALSRAGLVAQSLTEVLDQAGPDRRQALQAFVDGLDADARADLRAALG